MPESINQISYNYEVVTLICGLVVFAVWLGIVFSRGGFWRVRRHILHASGGDHRHVRVCAVVPARNEASCIARAVSGLLQQQFHGTLQVIVVDDHSDDDTAVMAKRAAETSGRPEALTVIAAEPLPDGWTGKLWAVSQGVQKAQRFFPDYILLTDADIEHSTLTLSTLVAKAENERLALTSLMVRLHCETPAEKMMIPAFVYFFFLLYPPAWISSSKSRVAGAAGGCMLLRPEALAAAGGIGSIRGEIIDDCALATRIKRSGGRVWLGLADKSASIRPYDTIQEIRQMIERTAFNQLHHSMTLLIATVIGLIVTFVLPLTLLFSRSTVAEILGASAIALMVASYLPMVLYYRLTAVWSLTLPVSACLYLWATLRSAGNFYRGKGGQWKGRSQDRGPVC